METRFVITAKNTQGLRTLAEPRQRRFTYETKEIAEQRLKDIIGNTPIETINFCMGMELEVRPVECYTGGDPLTCWFDTLEETERIMTEKENKK